MSEPENFLTRWSRRKQEAGRAVESPDDTPGDERLREAPAAEAPAAASKPAGEKQEEAFDLSSLPPLESIGARIAERNRQGWKGSGWKYFAQVRTDDIVLASYVVDEGRADPVGVTTALAKGAEQGGARGGAGHAPR